jgi:hypothetical protein
MQTGKRHFILQQLFTVTSKADHHNTYNNTPTGRQFIYNNTLLVISKIYNNATFIYKQHTKIQYRRRYRSTCQ